MALHYNAPPSLPCASSFVPVLPLPVVAADTDRDNTFVSSCWSSSSSSSSPPSLASTKNQKRSCSMIAIIDYGNFLYR